MKKLLLILLAAVPAHAATAFFSHETYSGGQTKQCHYRYLSEMYTINVKSYDICPITIEV